MRRLTPALVALVALAACERVVSVDVDEGPTRLVVEARLELVKGAPSGAQQIRLTTTSPYFDRAAPPPARGATVRVVDETGVTTTFAESPTAPGTYVTTQLVGVVGRAYTLRVAYAGEQYEATERMQAVAGIDSLYFAASTVPDATTTGGLRATIDLRDPRGVANWYLWDMYVDGVRVVRADSVDATRVTASDVGVDGRRLRGFQPYYGVVVAPGSSVLVRQIGLSETAYRYYAALSEQTANDGSPFSVPVASVRGNVANRTAPDRPALGYFIASEVAERRATVPR